MEGLSIDEFVESVNDDIPVVVDVAADAGWRFDLVEVNGRLSVTLGGMVAGALPMYQARSMTKAVEVDLSGTSSMLRIAKADPVAMSRLRAQVDGLNAGLERLGGLDHGVAMARTYERGGATIVGGLVTRGYTPVSHEQLLDGLAASPAFKDAIVIKHKADVGRIDAMIMLAGSDDVVGGLQAGIKIHNGQFGDRSYGFVAMIWRLLCGNGMIDVIASEESSRRHVGSVLDVSADAAEVNGRADHLRLLADTAMAEEIDTAEALVELHRRSLIGRGPLREALDRRNDLGGGGDGAQTRWSLAQAIAASARRYKIGQAEDLSRLAGRVVIEGLEPIRAANPIPVGSPSRDDVWEEFMGSEGAL
jgi:hypothetical protein